MDGTHGTGGSPSFVTTSPAPAPATPRSRVLGWNWPLLLLAALAVSAFVVALIYPTYPNYDSIYSLLWGDELLHGQLPSFDAYRAPTEHPLGVAFGALLSLLGTGGARVMVFATLASFVVLVAGLYRLGRVAFTPLVGVIAGVILCTRFDFPFLAARGYIDVPYLALVIWAAALEAERPRTGARVLLLLALAGLLRPEAWLISGVYWLYLFPRLDWNQRIRLGLLVGSAPLLWMATDAAVTGDPLFSQHHTSGLAEELGRQKGLNEVPRATINFMKALVKLPVALAAVAGLGLAGWLTPTRIRVPAGLLVIGLGTFGLVGAAGLSVINRYLLAPALMVMLFGAVAAGGWTMLREGRARRIWAGAAIAAVIFAGIWTALRVDLHRLTLDLRYRGDSRVALSRLLGDPRVRAAARCGPVRTPNHRLIPDVRWLLNLPEHRVVARSDIKHAKGITTGLTIIASSRRTLLLQSFNPDDTSPEDTAFSLPPAGFTRVPVASPFYAAYVRCPGT